MSLCIDPPAHTLALSGASASASARRPRSRPPPAHLYDFNLSVPSFNFHMATTGVKRQAQEDIDHGQRLAKRFELLDLAKRPPGNHAHPYEANARVQKGAVPATATAHFQPHATLIGRSTSDPNDCMELEDTKHRVYVHDLDAELEEFDDDPTSDSEHPIFLADIEKHLMKIPKHVLNDDHTKQTLQDMQLVLYGAPVSLTVPEEKDSVRRAIIEARQRARTSQALAAPSAQIAFADIMARNSSFVPAPEEPQEDPDEMDIG